MCLIICFKCVAYKIPEALRLITVYSKACWLPQVVSRVRSASSSREGSRQQGLWAAPAFGYLLGKTWKFWSWLNAFQFFITKEMAAPAATKENILNERLFLSRKRKKRCWSLYLFIINYHLHFPVVSKGQVIVKTFWAILKWKRILIFFFFSSQLSHWALCLQVLSKSMFGCCHVPDCGFCEC